MHVKSVYKQSSFFFILICYLCTSHLKAPQPPIRTLAADWGGGLSTQIHSMLVPRKVGNSMEVTVFDSPTKRISGAVTPWSTVFIFTPHSDFAYYYRRFNCSHFPKRINHYYKHLSVFGITLLQIISCYCGMYIWTGLI